MKRFALIVLVLAAVALVPARPGQEPGYPMTVIPIAKGPFNFPAGYQTPWDKIEIRGDGEDVAEPLRAARFARPRSGTSRRVGRPGHGALRTRWRPDGRYRRTDRSAKRR